MYIDNLNANTYYERNYVTVSGYDQSSAFGASNEADKAFDDDTITTYWYATQDAADRYDPQWIGWHFGDTPVRMQVFQMFMHASSDVYSVNRYLIQATNDEAVDWDDKVWITLLDNQNTVTVGIDVVEVENNNYYKYYRLYTEDTENWLVNSANSWIIYELRTYDSISEYFGTTRSQWNPNDIDVSYTLSNSNRTALKTSGGSTWDSVAAEYGVDRGKWYWEVNIDVMSSFAIVGVFGVLAPVTNYAGSDVYSIGYLSNANIYAGGGNSAYGSTYTTGDVIGAALDMDNRKLWFSKNGVWQSSGDPVTGANPIVRNSYLEDFGYMPVVFPAISIYGLNGQSTGNFKLEHLSYPPPSGYNIYPNFSDVIPEHNSMVYGKSEVVGYDVSISGVQSYTTNTELYYYTTTSGYSLYTTVTGVSSPSTFNPVFSTPSGITYKWFTKTIVQNESSTLSGVEFYTPTYVFDNRFLCAGTVTINDTASSGVPVRLYRRLDGAFVGSDISAGVSGTFAIASTYNEPHYVVGIHPTDSGTNASIYDHLVPA